jgi:LPXTG-motif cell wall-anchored protein
MVSTPRVERPYPDDDVISIAARHRVHRRRPGLAGAMCATALAVAGGIWAGHAAAPKERVEPPAMRAVRAGVATLQVPTEWRTVARGTGAAASATAVFAPSSGLPERVIVTLAPVDDRSLIPSELRRLVRDLGEGPRVTWLAGHRAWRYGGLPGRSGSDVLDVTVLPSSAGTLGVGCISPLEAASATADCASSIRSVSLSDAAIFVPSPDLALSLALPDVLTALDRERVRGRAGLRAAATHGAQARFALRLARAHRDAAASLRSVAARAGASPLVKLTNTADAYAALARAARAGDASRFRAVRRTVEAAEARLDQAIDRLASGAATARVPAQPTRSRSVRPDTGSAHTALIVLLGASVLSLLLLGLLAVRNRGFSAWGLVGPGRSPVRGGVCSGPLPIDPARPRAVRRAPPHADPSARWDAPPAGPLGPVTQRSVESGSPAADRQVSEAPRV